MQSAPIRKKRGLFIAAARIAVSGLLLYLLTRNLELKTLWIILDRMSWITLGIAGSLILLQSTVLALRWSIVMDTIRAPLGFAKALPLMFIGVFFNQVLPTAIGGDAVRIWRLYRAGIDHRAAINGVLLERITGLFGLVVLIVLGVVYMGPRIDNPLVYIGLLATLPLTLIGFAVLTHLDRVPARWRRLRVVEGLGDLAADSRRILSPRAAFALLVLSLASHALASIAVYALANGLGLTLTVWDCLALMPSVILITMIPISYAAWGLREGGMVAMLAFAGIGADAALAVSLAFGVVMLGASLPGYLIWLAQRETASPRRPR